MRFGHYFMVQHDLCLSHSVPNIIVPKVGLFFHQFLSFYNFKSIGTTFLLDFIFLTILFFMVLISF